MLGSVKSVYTLAKCRRNLGGFELTKFKSEALQIYENVNQMIADGERNKLQHVSSEYLLLQLVNLTACCSPSSASRSSLLAR